MSRLVGLGSILLIMFVIIEAKKNPSTNIQTRCLGNILRVDVGPLEGKLLDVAVVVNNSAIVLTPALASQCGFRIIHHMGNAMIYASIQNCFAHNVHDQAFKTTLNLRLHGDHMADELYQLAETCQYTWASSEILCDHSYMEVSAIKLAPNPAKHPDHGSVEKKIPLDSGFKIATVVFSTPEEKSMTVDEATGRGYVIVNTPSRLLLRSPKNSQETFTQEVAELPMTVLKTSTVFKKEWQATQIDAAAACPTQEGSVFFTPDTITWFLPSHIDPLIISSQFQLLDVQMGVNGERVSAAEMAARKYSLSVRGAHIVVEVPIGAVGGYFKSHIQHNEYLTSYTIDLMLELLWTENGHGDTRYKVLLPITTPLMSRPPQVTDYTVPKEKVFKLQLGPLGTDVTLVKMTFPSEVLTVAECNVRGFNVLEHASSNSSTKYYTLQVPFTDRVVLQLKTVHTLHITFGLLVPHEYAEFSHTAHLEANLGEIGYGTEPRAMPRSHGPGYGPTVPPSISGGCDHNNFYILVKYGSYGSNFQTLVGKSLLTPDMAHQYGLMENATHFSIVVPYSSLDVAFEVVQSSSIRGRLDVILQNPKTLRNVKDFSLGCDFPSTMTECFPNGTMTARAVKLESVPSLNPSHLTLRDPTCGPSHSDERFAYFVFTGNSCGTSRKFRHNVMVYENEISLPDELEMRRLSKDREPEYELKVYCRYEIKKNHALAFHTRHRRSEPFAENAGGELQIEMRLAEDDSYSVFHQAEDYPMAKYLQQPMYFEVALMGSTNPQVSLELENCWATQDQDRTSKPRWNLIINGCANPADPYQLILHPVWADSRVAYPSHYKRFEIQMFAFAEDLSGQLFVHCDVVMCDARNPLDRACLGQCSNQENGMKGQKRAVSDVCSFKQVSTGAILFN